MFRLKIKTKKPWQISQGNQPHKRGEIFGDKRTKRVRTRQAQRKRWQNEF